MPVSVTKSVVSEDIINKMAQKAFGENAKSIVELKEGFFNVAYKVSINDQSIILKIAPPKYTDIMTHEKNIMFSEVDAMNMVSKVTSVPVPKILCYDDSCTIIDRQYFFMEMLEGKSFSSSKVEMTEEQQNSINFDIGKYTKMLNQIEGDQFGYYCQDEKQGNNWYEVFKSMILDTYFDAERKNIIIPIEKESIVIMLEKDKSYFEAVKTPKFVHWDIWPGNVFIDNGNITGIIDFERCMWADVLMEIGFRTCWYEKAFFDGYGIEKLTEAEERRAKWYDVYLFLISILECDYRQYDNRGAYEWGCDMLLKWLK